MKRMGDGKGFTLIELIVTIALVAIVSSVVLIVINPAELLKQARDGKRFTELNTLAKAISLYEFEGGSIGNDKMIYFSYPDPTATTTAGTIGLCAGLGPGWRCRYPASSTYRRIDGTGWIPFDFRQLSISPPITTLPVDPSSNTSTILAFAVGSSTWKLFSTLESSKYLARWATDGGTSVCSYEAGKNINLDLYNGTMVAGYQVGSAWDLLLNQFLVDCGPRNISGQLGSSASSDSADPAWAVDGSGNRDSTLSFDGGDYVIIGTNSRDVAEGSELTVEAWVRLDTTGSMAIITKNVVGDLQWSLWHNASNNFLFAVRTSGGTQQAQSDSTAYSTGVWYHVAGVYDGSAVRLYVNGVAADSTPPALSGTIIDRQHLIIIGGDYVSSTTSGSPSFRGDLDRIVIWDRALTSAEVLATYSGTL